MYRIGFDVGGTFTDFTLHDTATGTLRHFKLVSTPADPSEAIAAGLRTLLETLHIAPNRIGFIGHGTTVATNMVIERRGVPRADHHARHPRRPRDRPPGPAHLRLHGPHAGAAGAAALRRGVERIDAAGAVLHPLDGVRGRRGGRRAPRAGCGGVAICFPAQPPQRRARTGAPAGRPRAAASICRPSACCRIRGSAHSTPRSMAISARGCNVIPTACSVFCLSLRRPPRSTPSIPTAG
jgi:hypothetical protein